MTLTTELTATRPHSAATAGVQPNPFSAAGVDRPAYLMCPPFSHAAHEANNVWMTEYKDGAGEVDRRRSLVQFLDLYNFLSAEALVYLLPAPATSRLQDQVFTANLAFVPEIGDRQTVIMANYTSAPRKGEEGFGRAYFRLMGYRVVDAPFRFEGEAEIKHLHGNTYIGGYGERTDRRVYDWMRDEFGLDIIPVEERDPHFYHLDCSVFPISREETLVCTKLFRPEEIKALEKVTGIIDASEDHTFYGICNSLRLNNLIVNASCIHELKPGHEDYQPELNKNRFLEDICAARGLEPVMFNLSEYFKSGALLSCMVMHLNRFSFDTRII
ncbi:MAG: arginine deiminase-related protein [Pseudomonadota bacterium]|jgi:N-dimethylarginine dimethylaminohydrolase